MNAWNLWALVPVTVLCSLNLLVGLGIVYLVADARRAKRPRATSVSRREVGQFAAYQTGLDRLLQQAVRLSTLCKGPNLPALHTLAQSIAELVEATSTLKRQLDGTLRGLESRRPTSRGAVPHAAHPPSLPRRASKDPLGYDLSGGEFSALVSTFDGDEPLSAAALSSERRQYRVKQFMAPCVHGRLPASTDFQPVLCNEISVGGISFYCDHAQVAQQVIVTLGEGEQRLFVMAEVKNRRVAQVDGNTIYLVGCRFLRRLNQAADEEQLSQYRTLFAPEPVLV